MARFPRTEAEVLTLAQAIVSGMGPVNNLPNANFPEPPVTTVDLTAVIDEFTTARNAAIARTSASSLPLPRTTASTVYAALSTAFAPTTAAAPRREWAAAAMAEAMTAQSNQNDPLDGLLSEARTRIRNQMQPAQIEDPTDDDLRTAEAILTPLVDQFFRNAQAQGVACASESDQVLRQLMDDIFGFGPLASYLADEKVEEIICNGKMTSGSFTAIRARSKSARAFAVSASCRTSSIAWCTRRPRGWISPIRPSTGACETARVSTPSWSR